MSELTKTRGTSGNEADIIAEAEEGGDGEVFCVWSEGHNDVSLVVYTFNGRFFFEA